MKCLYSFHSQNRNNTFACLFLTQWKVVSSCSCGCVHWSAKFSLISVLALLCLGGAVLHSKNSFNVRFEETEMTMLVLMEGKICLQMNHSPNNCRNQHSDEKGADTISILTYCFWSIGTLLKGIRAQWKKKDVSRNHNIYPYLQHAERNLLAFLFPVAIYLG